MPCNVSPFSSYLIDALCSSSSSINSRIISTWFCLGGAGSGNLIGINADAIQCLGISNMYSSLCTTSIVPS